jgi:hypothetical protein
MVEKRTRMSLLWLALPLAAAGCDPQPSGELAVLPMHGLDLSSPSASPAAPSPGARRGGVRKPHEWSAEGYRPWRYIVIHHSATDRGSAVSFDRMHRRRGWDELGYHFVIDNGKGGPEGRVEVGSRWRAQKWGAHTGGTPNNEYNNFGIGICLVGDFTRKAPSAGQLQSLRRLVTYLAREHDIPPQNVITHRDAPKAATKCPGRLLHEYVHGTLRADLGRRLASRRP